MLMKNGRPTAAGERKKEILKRAWKEGRSEEVHEKMQTLYRQSIDGYQGDDVWANVINRTLHTDFGKTVAPKTLLSFAAQDPSPRYNVGDMIAASPAIN